MKTLIGKKAPDFKTSAVVNGEIVQNFTLSQFFGKKYVVLFFYPKDFTFVCPTEILAFQQALPEFEKRNVEVIGCSTDSEFSHFAWINTPRNKGGIEGVTFPIVADINKTVSASYGVLAGDLFVCKDEDLCDCKYGDCSCSDCECQDDDDDDELCDATACQCGKYAVVTSGELVALRGAFLIDKQGIIQHQVINNMPLGRSTIEELRMVDALQHFEKFGEVCPMNWSVGKPAISPTSESTAKYLGDTYTQK